MQSEEQIWSYRPTNSYLLDSLAKTVSYLRELREPLLKDIMTDFYIAVDDYVSVLRDLSAENFLKSQVCASYIHNYLITYDLK